MAEKTIWGIHAGRTGDADTLFLKKNCIAIGWAEMGDLSQYKATREAFKAGFIKAYPHTTKPGAICTGSGQPFRFVHEMKEGDCGGPKKLYKKTALLRGYLPPAGTMSVPVI